MMTDAELLQRYVRDRSETAFAELVQRHVTLVYSAALRQLGGDAHLAQDVAQDVFTALARKARQLSGRASIAGWLYLGTHHAAAQTVRALQRRRVREQEAHVMHEILASENGGVRDDWARVRPVLDEAMRQLGETDREAVLLRYFARRPFEEIGAALNLSADAARMRVDRAIDKLRAVLERRGITSTSAALATALGSSAAVAAPPVGLVVQLTRSALAGAAGGGAPVFPMNLPLIVSSGIAAAGIGLAVFQSTQVRRVEAQNEQLRRTDAALRQELADVKTRTRKAEATAGAMPPVAARAFTPGRITTSPVQPPQAMWSFRPADGRPVESMPAAMDPEGRRKQWAEAADISYAALMRKQGWSDAQRAHFVALFVDRKEKGQRLFEAASVNRTKEDRVYQVVWEQTGVEFEENLRTAFGENAVVGLREFESTKVIRNLADSLARDLFYSATPLSAAEVEQFIDAVAGVARTAEGKIKLSAVNSEVMLATAATVLSEPQLKAFQQLQLRLGRNTSVENHQ